MAERWMYSPSVGLALILSFILLYLWQRQRSAASVLLVCVLGSYAIITINRNKIWQSPKVLYESMVADAPRSVQGYTGLAQLALKEGNILEASRKINAGMKIYAHHPALLEAAALASAFQNDYDSSKKFIEESILLNRDSRAAYSIYAIVLAKQGKYRESLAVINTHLHDWVDQEDVRFLLAVNYWKLGNSTEAKKYFDWAGNLSEQEQIRLIESF